METQKLVTQTVEPKKPDTVEQMIRSKAFAHQVSVALPKHCTPDRFIRIALTAIVKNPELGKCTMHSVYSSLLTLSQLGIEADGRRAHLIPFKNRKTGVTDCQLIIDYKGLVELVMRSGEVSFVHADIVCENDVFEFNMGRITAHKINFKAPRGKTYAAYAYAKLKDGNEFCQVLSLDEIESVRQRSKAKDYGPWQSDWGEMAKKTAFRRLSKWLPLSPDLQDKVSADEDTIKVTLPPPANVTALPSDITLPSLPDAAQPEPEQPKPVEPTASTPAQEDNVPMEFPAKTEAGAPELSPAQQALANWMQEAQVTFGGFAQYCITTNLAKNADSWSGYGDVPEAVCALIAGDDWKIARKVAKIYRGQML